MAGPVEGCLIRLELEQKCGNNSLALLQNAWVLINEPLEKEAKQERLI